MPEHTTKGAHDLVPGRLWADTHRPRGHRRRPLARDSRGAPRHSPRGPTGHLHPPCTRRQDKPSCPSPPCPRANAALPPRLQTRLPEGSASTPGSVEARLLATPRWRPTSLSTVATTPRAAELATRRRAPEARVDDEQDGRAVRLLSPDGRRRRAATAHGSRRHTQPAAWAGRSSVGTLARRDTAAKGGRPRVWLEPRFGQVAHGVGLRRLLQTERPRRAVTPRQAVLAGKPPRVEPRARRVPSLLLALSRARRRVLAAGRQHHRRPPWCGPVAVPGAPLLPSFACPSRFDDASVAVCRSRAPARRAPTSAGTR